MEYLDKSIYSLRELRTWLQKREKIVIYGAGDYGKKLIDYLFSIKEDLRINGIIVTKKTNEKNYQGIEIWDVSEFVKKFELCPVIIAVSSLYIEDIVKKVQQYCIPYCCMTWEVYKDIEKKLNPLSVSYSKIDFLCPGFVKCGTSSLYNVLNPIDSIYLPWPKENHFFEWRDKVQDADEILIEKYFDNITIGQKVGIIDPTYVWEEEKVYNYFGNDIKIIFLVRNPVDAVFSEFKMAMRDGWEEWDNLYLKYDGIFNIEMFNDFFDKDASDFEYVNWISRFERHYAEEQLKIIFLEELVRNPCMIINEILDFIGVMTRYTKNKLPKVNEGNYVMADLAGHKLVRSRGIELNRRNRCLSLHEVRKMRHQGREVCNEVSKNCENTKKIYAVQMTKEQRRKITAYYNNSVRKLEERLNKDLSKLWF